MSISSKVEFAVWNSIRNHLASALPDVYMQLPGTRDNTQELEEWISFFPLALSRVPSRRNQFVTTGLLQISCFSRLPSRRADRQYGASSRLSGRVREILEHEDIEIRTVGILPLSLLGTASFQECRPEYPGEPRIAHSQTGDIQISEKEVVVLTCPFVYTTEGSADVVPVEGEVFSKATQHSLRYSGTPAHVIIYTRPLAASLRLDQAIDRVWEGDRENQNQVLQFDHSAEVLGFPARAIVHEISFEQVVNRSIAHRETVTHEMRLTGEAALDYFARSILQMFELAQQVRVDSLDRPVESDLVFDQELVTQFIYRTMDLASELRLEGTAVGTLLIARNLAHDIEMSQGVVGSLEAEKSPPAHVIEIEQVAEREFDMDRDPADQNLEFSQLAAGSLATGGQVWFDDDWNYRWQFFLNTDLVEGSNKPDFAYCIRLEGGSAVDFILQALDSDAQADLDDLVVCDEDAITQLPHEIELYTAMQQLIVHFNIPILRNAGSQFAFLYWGNPTAGNQANTDDLWDRYHAVKHWNGFGSLPAIGNSASGVNAASWQTPVDVATSAAPITPMGAGRNFGVSSRVVEGTPNAHNSNTLTMSFLVRHDSFNGNGGRLAAKALNWNNDQTHAFMASTITDFGADFHRFRLYTQTEGGSALVGLGAPITLGAWNWVSFTYDGSNYSIMQNGVLAGSAPKTGNIIQNAWEFAWGANPGNYGQAEMTGVIAESRIGLDAVDLDRHTTEFNVYLNLGVGSGKTVLSFGPVEERDVFSRLQRIELSGTVEKEVDVSKEQTSELRFSQNAFLEGQTGGSFASQVVDGPITFVFDQPYLVGQFEDKSWWVVENSPGAGVQITSMPHVSSPGRDGAQIDRGTLAGLTQGFDSRGGTGEVAGAAPYSASFNATLTLPTTIVPQFACVGDIPAGGISASQMIAAKSHPGIPFNTIVNMIGHMRVLTVLSKAPLNGSLRPSIEPGTKTLYNISRINFGLLPGLDGGPSQPEPYTLGNPSYTSPPSGAIIPPAGIRAMDDVWIHYSWDFSSRGMSPFWVFGDEYGFQKGKWVGDILLHICSDMADIVRRNVMLYKAITWGMDADAANGDGSDSQAHGGHHGTRIALRNFARKMLGLPLPSPMIPRFWAETQSCYYVSSADLGGGFNAAQIGMPEYANEHAASGEAQQAWTGGNPYRYCCTFSQRGASILACRLIGITPDEYSNDGHVFFNPPSGLSLGKAVWDYMDRYKLIADRTFLGFGGSIGSGWLSYMWNRYRWDFGPNRSSSFPISGAGTYWPSDAGGNPGVVADFRVQGEGIGNGVVTIPQGGSVTCFDWSFGASSYSWSVFPTPGVTINNPLARETTISFLDPGPYNVTLTINGGGASRTRNGIVVVV